MKSITSIAAAALVAAGGVTLGAPSAEAANWSCGRIMGYNVCAIDRSYIDSLKLEWSNGDFTWIKVNCSERSYTVTQGGRYMTESQTDALTGQWCFG